MKKIIALGLLTITVSVVAADDDCCWMDVKTGKIVPPEAVVPRDPNWIH